MFEKLLIANRGEIACRIIATCRRLGIATVAVFSEADAGARHVTMADEARLIGPPPATQSYLAGEKILEAARRSGAQAIHPGYGFLSENADFAEACAASGVVFVGPPPDALRAMGSKSGARTLMAKAGVPLVPGYDGEAQGEDRLAAEAERIGWPVLIKASAGGGGKGMRVVHGGEAFIEALAAARRESAAAFGDDRLLLEKFLTRPRHVEIQVFADARGGAVHLFERDCSVQRRYQKVVEEAPAPEVSPDLRKAMGEAALAAVRAVGYVGAGTVEFLLDEEGAWYFMEMNTRLQVEHAVTEMITGQDLVEWQLRVAAGEPLPCRQEDLSINGHAVEVRIYAEDPRRDFLPCVGRLHHFRLPEPEGWVRVDTGVRPGDEITSWYDPMIAKLIVHGRDRPQALHRLRKALSAFQVAGVTTNLDLLSGVADHPLFVAGGVDTSFLDRFGDDLLSDTGRLHDEVPALACLGVLLHRCAGGKLGAVPADPHSPFHLIGRWRLNHESREILTFRHRGETVSVPVRPEEGGFRLGLSGGEFRVCGELSGDGDIVAVLEGKRFCGTVVRKGRELTVFHAGRRHLLSVIDPCTAALPEGEGEEKLTAPLPGRIVSVMVEVGDEVGRGTPLLILEAMKMEHTVTAPEDGVVVRIPHGVGEAVTEGTELVILEPGGDR